MAEKIFENKAVGMSRGGWNTKIHTFVDGLGNPLAFALSSGNDHDSIHAVPSLGQVHIAGSNILGDKAYGTKAIREYIASQKAAYTICPEFQALPYSTTNRDGYRVYKSGPKICKHCPTRELCTRSKDRVKTVRRHIGKNYEELADDARYTPKYQELYNKRKETIERVFADAKEKHAMRYTQYQGLIQVTKWVRLKFAGMNLKKLAKRKWRTPTSLLYFAIFATKSRILALRIRLFRQPETQISTASFAVACFPSLLSSVCSKH